MILVDTNVFIIDRFFKRDEYYRINRDFVNSLKDYEAYFSIFSLFELCGLASFNLSEEELDNWIYGFDKVYSVQILEPKYKDIDKSGAWFKDFSEGLFEKIKKNMRVGDAILLKEAEEHGADKIITWNKKDFKSRTEIEILNPKNFLELQPTEEKGEGNQGPKKPDSQ